MQSDLTRLARASPDASRQPPTCMWRSSLRGAHNVNLTPNQFRLCGLGSSRQGSNRKLLAGAVHGRSGSSSSVAPRGPASGDRPPASEELSEDTQQDVDTGWWRPAQQSDKAEQQLQQQRGQQSRPLRLGTAPIRRPAITPFRRTYDDRTSPGTTNSSSGPQALDRVLAASSDAAAASGGDSSYAAPTGATAASAQVLMPTAPSQPPAAGPGGAAATPHSRALGLLSTVVSVAAVGAYVYALVCRRQEEEQERADGGPMGQSPKAAGSGAGTPGSPAPAAPPKRAGAGARLFRPATTPPASPAATVAVAGTTAAAAPAAAGPVAAAAAAAKTAAAVAGPAQPPSSPARERGWWRRLGRLYYISFGAQFGLVPRVRLDGTAGTVAAGGGSGSSFLTGGGSSGSSSSSSLVVFEDPADAEFVANVLWEDLVQNGLQSPGPRPSTMGVLSAAPLFLEDLAAMRGAPVEAVPSDGLRKDMHLGAAQLEVVLAALVLGASPDEAAERARQLLQQAAAATTAADTDAGGGSGGAKPAATGRGGDAGRRAGAAAAGVRQAPPLARTAEQRGVKIKLPSKFDFPGFDAAATQGEATAPPPPTATESASTFASASAAAAVPATKAPFAAPAAPAPPAPAASVTVHTSQPSPSPSLSPPQASLPQVEPSAVREPVRSRSGDDSAGDSPFDARRWDPYAGSVIDAESVDVASAPAAPPSVSWSPDGASAPACAAAAAGVPSPAVDEAMREYRELERLLEAAMGGGGGAGGAAESRSQNAHSRGGSPLAAPDFEFGRAPRQEAALTDDAAVAARETEQRGGQQQGGAEAASRAEEAPQEAPQQKSGAERAKEILAEQGPTDAAMEAALAALVEDEEGEENVLLDEYYSIFNNGGRQERSSSSSSGSSSSVNSSGNSGNSSSGSGDVATEVAEVQRQLAGVIQAVAAAHARGVPPPADAAVSMQSLQQRLQNLQARLAANPAAAQPQPLAAAAAAVPPPPATAAATGRGRQTGSLFSTPAGYKPASSSSSNKGSGDSSSSGVQAAASEVAAAAEAPQAQPAAAAADPATLVTPLSSPGAAAAASTSTDPSGDGGSKAAARRAWGAWKTNRRIQEAEATLLKAATKSASVASPPPPQPAARPVAAAAPAAAGPMRDAGQAAAAASANGASGSGSSGGGGDGDGDGVVVMSKRVGNNRPPKVEEAPEARQDRVKEALRVFSQMGAEGDDDDAEYDGEDDQQLFGRSASLLAGGRRPWWQSRFQVLFLPTIGYPDGSMGFLQVNVSLSGERRDMRVLAFEDRSDCTACLTLLAQWPEYQGTDPRVSMMPTDKLLPQLQQIYDEQADLNGDVSRPRGLAVFRRGKLPMRPGMRPDDFLQLVMYQHAAQMALARTGYGFTA